MTIQEATLFLGRVSAGFDAVGDDAASHDALRPLALAAPILQLKWVEAGTGLSYGHTFVARRRTLVATVGLGYGDGYPRALSNRGKMLVAGRRCPVVGRVCMDLTLLDLTDHPLRDEPGVAPAIGTTAWAIGAPPSAPPAPLAHPDPAITWEEAAQAAGLDIAGLVGGIGPRVARVRRVK